jgi:hypothetical protein
MKCLGLWRPPLAALAVVTAATLLVACGPGTASAALTFDFDFEFSGGTPPAGPTPWITAVFTDSGPNTVTLTLSGPNLVGVEKVTGWYFNVDPAVSIGSLDIDQDPPGLGAPSASGISIATNAFKADGDGEYDILIEFPSGPPAAIFGAGDVAVFVITGSGITANSFDFLSNPAGGHGPFKAAAHVQGIGPNGANSGWVAPDDGNNPQAAPEPATIASALVLVPLGLLAAARRRRRV